MFSLFSCFYLPILQPYSCTDVVKWCQTASSTSTQNHKFDLRLPIQGTHVWRHSLSKYDMTNFAHQAILQVAKTTLVVQINFGNSRKQLKELKSATGHRFTHSQPVTNFCFFPMKSIFLVFAIKPTETLNLRSVLV